MTELERKINNLVEDYQENLILAKSIGFPEAAYEGTTATAEDILEGKTAYSNGKFIEGTMLINNNNATIKAGSLPTGAPNGGSGIIQLLESIDVSLSTGSDASYCFKNCAALTEIPKNLRTTNARKMGGMFIGCKSLKEIHQTATCLNMDKVTSASAMFQACEKLNTVGDLHLPELQYMGSMFKYCYNLVTIGRLYVPKVIDLTEMFWNNTYLRNLGGWIDLGKGYTQKTEYYKPYTLSLTTSTAITHESLMNVINGLYDLNLTYDVANGGTLYRQKLELSSACKSRLSAEEIAIAEAKGWTIV
jgi:hypothetical protein